MTADLGDLADTVLGWAADDEQVEVYVARGRDTEVRAYSGEIESFSSAESAGVGIRIVREGRQGFAYAGSLDPAVVKETYLEARDNSLFATVDEWNGLVGDDGVAAAALDLWDPALVTWSADDKIALALALEREVRARDRRIVGVESADVADSLVEAAIASTTGVRAEARRTACFATTYVLASAGDETQTGFGFTVGRGPGELDVGVAAAEAAERSTRLLGATKPSSGRVTVVLDPFVTAQLLGILGSTLSGDAVNKRRSLFVDRVGEQVATTDLTLVDDPTDARAFTASAYDAEGLASRRNVLLDRGVLRGFVHNGDSARRAGTVSTGNAVRAGFTSTPGVGCRALSLVPGDRTPAELISEVEDGVLVQSVAGLHSGVNPVSGDFSTGAEGVLIRDGELGAPVREFTIASTLQRLLLDVRAVADDLTRLPMSAAGVTLVVDGVTLSGR